MAGVVGGVGVEMVEMQDKDGAAEDGSPTSPGGRGLGGVMPTMGDAALVRAMAGAGEVDDFADFDSDEEDDGLYLGFQEMEGEVETYERQPLVKAGDPALAYQHVYRKAVKSRQGLIMALKKGEKMSELTHSRKVTQRDRLSKLLAQTRAEVSELDQEVQDLEEVSKHSTRVKRARGTELARLGERASFTAGEISAWCYDPDYEPLGRTVEEYALRIQKR